MIVLSTFLLLFSGAGFSQSSPTTYERFDYKCSDGLVYDLIARHDKLDKEKDFYLILHICSRGTLTQSTYTDRKHLDITQCKEERGESLDRCALEYEANNPFRFPHSPDIQHGIDLLEGEEVP